MSGSLDVAVRQMTSRSEQRADSDIQVLIHKAGPSPAGHGELIPHRLTCEVWIYKYLHLTNIIGLGWVGLVGSICECECKTVNSQEARMPGRNGFLVPAAIQ